MQANFLIWKQTGFNFAMDTAGNQLEIIWPKSLEQDHPQKSYRIPLNKKKRLRPAQS